MKPLPQFLPETRPYDYDRGVPDIFLELLALLFAGRYAAPCSSRSLCGSNYGFSIYVIGRISVFVAKRTKKTTEICEDPGFSTEKCHNK